MALKHASPLEVIDLHAGQAEPGSVSISLLKTPRLQLMRLVLPAGRTVPQHQVPGDVTIQCLAGEADVVTPSGRCPLRAGTLVMLPASEPHQVHAHADTVLLVTIVHPAP